MVRPMRLWLPWPPSVNNYWIRTRRGGVMVSKNGQLFRKELLADLAGKVSRKLLGRVKLSVCVMPPDKRKRDLDNLLKPILDGLTAAGVWDDDSQVDRLEMERGEITPHGRVLVEVSEIGGGE